MPRVQSQTNPRHSEEETQHNLSKTSPYFFLSAKLERRERSSSLVECLTRDRGDAGSSLTDLTVLCP